MNLKWQLSHTRGYLELEMLDAAEAELDAITPPDDDRLEVLALRVDLLHERKDWTKLRHIAGALMKRQPEEVRWWVSCAYATRRELSIDLARDLLLEAEKIHTAEAVIQFNLACYAAQLGELGEARARVKRSIELNRGFRDLALHDPDLVPLRETGGID